MTVIGRILFNIERLVKGYSMKKISEEAANQIRKRTRLGFGVKGGERGGTKINFKIEAPHTDKYKKFRKKNKAKLSPATAPGKNNLTLSGQLLDSIAGKATKNVATIFFKEDRNDGVANSDIVEGQAKQGRTFFELTDKELKGLQNQIKKDLIKSLRKKR